MRTYFYYGRDEDNRPVETNCLIVDGDKTAKGCAMCSDKDNPNKKIGRAIAKGRALKALTFPGYCEYDKGKVFYKSIHDPILAPYELKIIGKTGHPL